MLEEWLKHPDSVGATFILVFIITGLLKGTIVPKWVHQQTQKDLDFYKEIAFRTTNLAERSTAAAVTISQTKGT